MLVVLNYTFTFLKLRYPDILVGMLKKEKKRASDAMTMLEKAGQTSHISTIPSANQASNGGSSHRVRGHSEEPEHPSRRPASDSRRYSDRGSRISEKEKADEQKDNHTQYKICESRIYL